MKPIFLLISCVLAIATYSQDSSSTSRKGTKMIGYFGVHHIQYPHLNSKVSELGYEKPLSVFLAFGLVLSTKPKAQSAALTCQY
jgi:hypothetical protein